MFKLNIESSRDIDELSIVFSDGSYSCSTNGNTSNSIKSPKPRTEKTKKTTKSEYLDLDTDFGDVANDIITLPTIETEERPVNVAQELQNLDF